MIFTRRKPGSRARPDAAPAGLDALLREISALRASGGRDAERHILDLRHRAGLELLAHPAAEPPAFALPASDGLAADTVLPEVRAEQLTPGLLRAAMLRHGCLLVRGLVDRADAERLVEGIDRAYEARAAQAAGGPADAGYFEEFVADERFALPTERAVLRGPGAGLLAVDSPRVAADVLDTFERVGVGRLATSYLGESAAISINKSLLRRVQPTVYEDLAALQGDGSSTRVSGWHQDGAFLGDVRALNVWLALSRCGDVAPGMDVVPRRIDHIVPTGTEGSLREWSVSQQIAEESAGAAGIVRPVFEPGDALLFDELFLHATAAEPGMPNVRYAVESWFFGSSGFPERYAPLAF